MSVANGSTKLETLAWINDDEAEFWTNSTPAQEKSVADRSSTPSDAQPHIFSFDGLYFKTGNQITTETEDRLAFLHEQAIEQQEASDAEVEKKQHIFDIFQLDEDAQPSKYDPEKKLGFLDRLIHQLTRQSCSDTDYSDDEVFEQVDAAETTPVDHHSNTDKAPTVGRMPADEASIVDTLRSFLDELSEEKDVLLGTIDRETLISRRGQKLKASSPSAEYTAGLDDVTTL